MKKNLFFISLALSVILGICGGILRASQLTNAFDPITGGLISGAPSTTGLLLLCIVAAALAVIGAIIVKKTSCEECPECKKCIITPIAFSISALLILAYAGFILYELFVSGSAENLDITKLILALFSVYCAFSLFMLGKYNIANRDSTAYSVCAAVPVFWACFMLILTFRDKIADPVIADYVILIFSYISVLFCAYSIAAHALGKNKKHFAFLSCFLGIFFILTELISVIMTSNSFFSDTAKTLEFLAQAAFLIIMPAAAAVIVKKQ